jgi:hypothetical protein
MTTNNAVNAPFPLSATQGGTGVASPTQYEVPYANGSSPMTFAALANGQVLVGSTGAAPVPATITAGTNISVTNGANTITIATTGAGSFTWIAQATASVTMAVNTGYYITDASAVTLTLPATAAAGSIFEVAGYGAAGWTIGQASGQTIYFGNVHTTAGTGGSLASSNQYDCVRLLCTVANVSFVVLSSVGNITYV